MNQTAEDSQIAQTRNAAFSGSNAGTRSPFLNPIVTLVLTLGVAFLCAAFAAIGLTLITQENMKFQSLYHLIFDGIGWASVMFGKAEGDFSVVLLMLSAVFTFAATYIPLMGASLYGWKVRYAPITLLSVAAIASVGVSDLAIVRPILPSIVILFVLIMGSLRMPKPPANLALRVVILFLGVVVIVWANNFIRMKIFDMLYPWEDRFVALSLMFFLLLIFDLMLGVTVAIGAIVALGGERRRDEYLSISPRCSLCGMPSLPLSVKRLIHLLRHGDAVVVECGHQHINRDSFVLHTIGWVAAFALAVFLLLVSLPMSTWHGVVGSVLLILAIVIVMFSIYAVKLSELPDKKVFRNKSQSSGGFIGIAAGFSFMWFILLSLGVAGLLTYESLRPLIMPLLEVGPFALMALAASLTGWRIDRRTYDLSIVASVALIVVAFGLEIEFLQHATSFAVPMLILYLLWDGAKGMPGHKEVFNRNMVFAALGSLILMVYANKVSEGMFEEAVRNLLVTGNSFDNVLYFTLLNNILLLAVHWMISIGGFIALGGAARARMGAAAFPDCQDCTPLRWVVSPRALWKIAFGETAPTPVCGHREPVGEKMKLRATALLIGGWLIPGAIALVSLLGIGLSPLSGISLAVLIAVAIYTPLSASATAEDREARSVDEEALKRAEEMGEDADQERAQEDTEFTPAPPPTFSADELIAERKRARLILGVGSAFFLVLSGSVTALALWATESNEQRASRVADACAEIPDAFADHRYQVALRERCVNEQCQVLSDAAMQHNMEVALAAAHRVVESGGTDYCGASLAIERAENWSALAAAKPEKLTPKWCYAFQEYRVTSNDSPSVVDSILLPEDSYLSQAADCVELLIREIDEASIYRNWDRISEADRYLRYFRDELDLKPEHFIRVDIMSKRASACRSHKQAVSAEHAGAVEIELRQLASYMEELSQFIHIEPGDIRSISRAMSAAEREKSRCDRIERNFDQCIDRCDSQAHYRSYRWYDYCVEKHCPQNYRTCDMRRDTWQKAGKPRSNVSVPNIDLCSGTWSMSFKSDD